MSSQSAATRNASQATVNMYRESGPVDPTEPASGSRSEAEVSVWWIPAVIAGAWAGFAYVVPALADFLAQLT